MHFTSVNGKEIPDDDFLAVMFGNKSRDPMDFFFRNALKIKLGPADEVKESILSFKSGNRKEKMTNEGKEDVTTSRQENGMKYNGVISAAINAPTRGNDDKLSIDYRIDDDEEGSGTFDNEENGHKFNDDENGEDNNENDNIKENSNDLEKNNSLGNAGSNKTEESDIEILPLECDYKDSKNHPPEAAADFSLILNLLLQCLKQETDDAMSRVPLPSSETNEGHKGWFTNDASNGVDHVRNKRSTFRRISRYEYFWYWLYPYVKHTPYRKTFDSIASGIIGKRSQFDK